MNYEDEAMFGGPHAAGALDARVRELAALHALGALAPQEARAFEAHVDECRACEVELSAQRRLAGEVALVAEPVEPPPDLLGRVMQSTRVPVAADNDVQTWKSWRSTVVAGLQFALDEDAQWQTLSVPGIEVRQLMVDAAQDRVSMLVRMAPGSAYPPHRHAGFEECYVLSGELRIDDVTMRAGDYQCAAAGSTHPTQSTAGGCLLFISSSMRDELLPSP